MRMVLSRIRPLSLRGTMLAAPRLICSPPSVPRRSPDCECHRPRQLLALSPEARRFITRWLSPLVRVWFRPTIEGLEHLPRGRVIVANHSAGAAAELRASRHTSQRSDPTRASRGSPTFGFRLPGVRWVHRISGPPRPTRRLRRPGRGRHTARLPWGRPRGAPTDHAGAPRTSRGGGLPQIARERGRRSSRWGSAGGVHVARSAPRTLARVADGRTSLARREARWRDRRWPAWRSLRGLLASLRRRTGAPRVGVDGLADGVCPGGTRDRTLLDGRTDCAGRALP